MFQPYGQAHQPRRDALAGQCFLAQKLVRSRDVNEVLAVPGEAGAVTPMAGVKCSGGSCSQLMVTGEGTPAQRTRSSQRTEGGLLVEVIEPRSIRVVWRALNTGKACTCHA